MTNDNNTARLPEGLEIIPASNGTEAHVFLVAPLGSYAVNGDTIQLGGWTMHEAGEIAWAIFNAIPRAIAMDLEAKVGAAVETLTDHIEARIEPEAE